MGLKEEEEKGLVGMLGKWGVYGGWVLVKGELLGEGLKVVKVEKRLVEY